MKLAMPRVLPAAIVAIVTLLGIKSIPLVRAAMPHVESTASPAAISSHPASAVITPPVVAAAVPPEPAPVSEAERALLGDLRQRRAGLDSRAQALRSAGTRPVRRREAVERATR